MNISLTMQERFEELRKERGLTLEQLSEKTGISRAALGKYESDDYKDISPFSIVTLAKFYGVSSDYLLGLTEQKNHPNTEIHALHLSDKVIDLLKSGTINNRLLCEIMTHERFCHLMADIEIYVDRIASMQIQNLNAMVDMARAEIMTNRSPQKDDLYIHTLEAAHIQEDEYFSHMVSDDIVEIARDIRDAHRIDTTTAADSETSIARDMKQNIEEVMNFQGSAPETQIKMLCSVLEIPYDDLKPEEFIGMMNGLKKSKVLKSLVSQRGKKRTIRTQRKPKRKR